jgi:hypothetical protein
MPFLIEDKIHNFCIYFSNTTIKTTIMDKSFLIIKFITYLINPKIKFIKCTKNNLIDVCLKEKFVFTSNFNSNLKINTRVTMR